MCISVGRGVEIESETVLELPSEMSGVPQRLLPLNCEQERLPDVGCSTRDVDVSLGLGFHPYLLNWLNRRFHLSYSSWDEYNYMITDIFFISCSFIYVHLFLVS